MFFFLSAALAEKFALKLVELNFIILYYILLKCVDGGVDREYTLNHDCSELLLVNWVL